MGATKEMLSVSGIAVEVVRKNIKNLHLAVYPPDGRVRVAVPEHVTDDNVRLAVISKLSWIKKQQTIFSGQSRQSARLFVSGERHYFLGKPYRLELVERRGKHEIEILRSGKLKMFARPGTTIENKEKLMYKWYRDELRKVIPALLEKWQPIVGKEVSALGIKKMKTKWGSCNIEKQSVWLNLELAKKPIRCLEFVLVHELVHLLERNHNEHFATLMSEFLPTWRADRKLLHAAPLAHEEWVY